MSKNPTKLHHPKLNGMDFKVIVGQFDPDKYKNMTAFNNY